MSLESVRQTFITSAHRHYRLDSLVMSAAQRLFLSSPRYAVVGASKDQTKFGTKVRLIRLIWTVLIAHEDFWEVLKWYQTRNKTVTPVHPVCFVL